MKRSIFWLHTAVGLLTAAHCRSCAVAGQFQITTNNSRKLANSAAFDGTNYLVGMQGDNLFSRANTNSQVAVRLVTQSGTPVSPLTDIGRNAAHNLQYAAFDGT